MIAILGDIIEYYSSSTAESEEDGTEFPLEDYGNLQRIEENINKMKLIEWTLCRATECCAAAYRR